MKIRNELEGKVYETKKAHKLCENNDTVTFFRPRYCYRTGVNIREIESLLARGNKGTTLGRSKTGKLRCAKYGISNSTGKVMGTVLLT